MMKATTVRSALLAILSCLSAAAVAQADAPKQIDIPAGDLSDALIRLSKQYGIDLFYRPEQVRGLKTQGAHGELTTEQAVSRLIEGTQLKLSTDSTGAMVIGVPEANHSSATAENVDTSAGAPKGVNHGGMQLAQSETAAARAASSSQDKAEKPASEGGGSSEETKLQEIVVSAQKRVERLQDVPISISVLRGSDLDSSTAEGITEALNSVPGVMAQQSYIGGGTQVAVRGVAGASTILHGSSPIAYYLDSVPFGLIKTSIAPDSNAYDMERVEVLRGPQGTLYGASALNGVVRVLTKDANLDRFEFKGRTSASSTEGGSGNYRGDLAINVPLIEGKLAARAVIGHERQSGWIDKPNEKEANDARLRNYRLKINAQPTDQLSIGVSAWNSSSDYGAPSMSLDDGTYSIAGNEPMSSNYEVYGLRIGYDISGSISIEAMTSYLDYDNSGVLDLAPLALSGIPFVNQYFAHMFTQEVNVNSAQGGDWRWSLGALYRDANDRTFQQIPGIFPADVNFNDTSKSFAVFGEVTRLFLERRLELTMGLRYFKDDVSTDENSSFTGVPNTPLIGVSSDFSKTTPRVVLNWHPSDRFTTYVSYAEGFRSGFQQQPNVILSNPQIPPVDADSLKNYEFGAKGTLLEGRIGFDTAIYYIDWQDVQTNNSILIAGIPIAALVNGESASGAGFDLSVTFEPVDHLRLGVSFSTNRLSWDESSPIGSAVSFSKGDRLNLSPKYTAGASVSYDFALGRSGYDADFAASASYNSSQFINTTTGFGQADEITIARASFSVHSPARWTATLYGDNLNNEDGAIQQAPFNVADWTVRPRPRTLGLQLEYRF